MFDTHFLCKKIIVIKNLMTKQSDYIAVVSVPQILKYTPEGHPDRENLDEALARATEVCGQVNEGVKEKDNSDKLEWIQTHVHYEGLPEVRLRTHGSTHQHPMAGDLPLLVTIGTVALTPTSKQKVLLFF